ncbi:putative baseplate assembly protein [Cohnella fermenti]|uniref:Putative baseplate assembly protein n=1 Tax=Cohnella fermenti TaxID=2565925 RepID=A0A4S4BLZ1_9BACL|nr:putative baseplate assembly protein [Cohnella fermenti]THF73389.1 putative baseplate assembly protein [Cohnella fermenti]
MLPLPNLDDRTFEELIREARDLLPGILESWTDQNEHDPGMTLLELLAWHLEMQQFQLDRLTGSHERKFLKLLGEAPRDRSPATTSVSFSKAPAQLLLPYGTLLRVGDLPFETVRPLTILPDTERRIFIHTDEGISEVTDDFESGSAPFHPFGLECRVGSSLIIEFRESLPEEKPLSLWFQLHDQEPDLRIPARYKLFTPSGKVEWRYWREGGPTNEADTSTNEAGAANGSWELIDLERDESYGFHQSGPILFQIPRGAGNVHRIRATLADGEYSDPPYIRRLMWNEVFAKQGRTMALSELFDGAPDGSRTVRLGHALFGTGLVSVQLKTGGGAWFDADEGSYAVERLEGETVVRFADEAAWPAGERSVRIIAVDPEFADRIELGRGTGLSGQTFPLPIVPLLPDEFGLQVGWRLESDGEMVWQDWERVLDFDESYSGSLHYVIDEEEGVVRFSDGVHGAVPPASAVPNIRITGYRIGVGEEGNVKAVAHNEIDLIYPLQVTNLFPAYGGAEPETLKEAMQRAKLSVLEPSCGVTAEDLERRVMEIPGLRIARVKAIPGYKPTLENYPAQRSYSDTSIVIVPYSRRSWPRPAAGMMATVHRHLEPYRLLTTKLHVIPPEYVRVTVRAVIVVEPRYEGRENEVKAKLSEWLQPYGQDSLNGWEFGKPIYKSDVYDVIHRVPGIRYIQDVWLMADGRGVHREEGGDVRIPPNGLVVSGDHEIEFVTSF